MFFVQLSFPILVLLLHTCLPANSLPTLLKSHEKPSPTSSQKDSALSSPSHASKTRHKRSFTDDSDNENIPQITIEGFLGCKYDLDVCNVNELCFNDDLFGQCWNGVGSPRQAFALTNDVNDLLNGNKLAALEHTFHILQRYQLGWKDYVTQCILTQILADHHSYLDRERLDDFYLECLRENEQLNKLILADTIEEEDRALEKRRLEGVDYILDSGIRYRDPYLSGVPVNDDINSFYVPLPASISEEDAAALRLTPQHGHRLSPAESIFYNEVLNTIDQHLHEDALGYQSGIFDVDLEYLPQQDIQDEAIMNEPAKLTLPITEHRAGLLETLQINNNKQPYPFFNSDGHTRNNTKTNESQGSLAKDATRYFTISTARGYIAINREFRDTIEGSRLLALIAQTNAWPLSIFTELNTDGNVLTYHVLENPYNINATNVANSAFNIQKNIENSLGFHVIDSGIGDRRGQQLPVERRNGSQLAIVTLVTCAIVLFVMGAFALLYFLKRNDRIRNKLAEITHIKGLSTNDYQDLCRQRMSIQPTVSSSSKLLEAHNVQRQEQAQAPPSPSSQVGTPYTPPGIANAKKERGSEGSSNRSSTSSWSEDPVPQINMDIMTGHLILSYMEDHLSNKNRIDAEWQALSTDEVNTKEDCSIALSPANAKKNRYVDCLPYDSTRVILTHTGEENDYINASPITDSDPKCKYIATQGPMPNTTSAFWKMIWEQGCCVIVALTRPIEDGVTMCHHYWPVEGSERFNDYEVNLVSEHIWSDDYLVRSFYLKNMQTMETRTVTQFHFLTWPELGIPPTAKTLLDFRRKVNKCFRGKSGSPIVVHCNDGVGRTGAYILLDITLNRICKGAREIDIATSLEHIREQRPNMVKSKSQFEFTFAAVAEEVTHLLKAIPQ